MKIIKKDIAYLLDQDRQPIQPKVEGSSMRILRKSGLVKRTIEYSTNTQFIPVENTRYYLTEILPKYNGLRRKQK